MLSDVATTVAADNHRGNARRTNLKSIRIVLERNVGLSDDTEVRTAAPGTGPVDPLRLKCMHYLIKSILFHVLLMRYVLVNVAILCQNRSLSDRG